MHFIFVALKLILKPQVFIILIFLIGILSYQNYAQQTQKNSLASNFQNQISNFTQNETKLQDQLKAVSNQLEVLKSQDQVKKNQELEGAIKNIEESYKKAVSVYEMILDYKGVNSKKTEFETNFAKSLKYLSDRNDSSASALLNETEKKIKEATQKQAESFTIPENVKESSAPPASGYSRQKVAADTGVYLVDVVAADLNSTTVIVDTASDSDCADNCPVLPLSDYVSRNGAFAGINGSYFCPASYPQCAGKANSYDTLLMNKNKKYFNSDNNVYSNVPAAIFYSGGFRFVGASSQWGRDTSVDSVIANHPLLLSGGNIAFGGNSDPKQGSKGTRSFIAAKGSTVYIGVVHNATVAEVAHALKAMGLSEALNLDSGGSTALWSGGYKAGPGRNIPNAVLFVRR